MNNNPLFYKGLIVCFAILYALVAFISFWHCIAFCLVGNPIWISVMMSFAFEVGLAATLFSILTTDNKNNYVAWTLMTFLTGVQVIGNVYSVYKYMVETGTKFYTYINDSMLHWFVEDVPNNEIMSIIAIILGALLPIVALLMTSMVSNNLKLWLNKKKEELPPSVPVPDNEFSNIPESPEETEPDVDSNPGRSIDEILDERYLKKQYPTISISKDAQDFAETPEIPENKEPEGLVKEREDFYNALDEFKEQEEREKKVEDLFKEHFNEVPEELAEQDSSEDFNLDFEDGDRSNDIPIQDVVADSPVADVSILDIDNHPAQESASETINPQPPKKYPLKGKVEGSDEVISVMNMPNNHEIHEKLPIDSSVMDPTPLNDTINNNIEVIKKQQGPFSLFKPGQ